MTTDHHEPLAVDRSSVRERQEERFGGVKIGSAFFGWISATGTLVILTGLVAAVAAGIGLVSSADQVSQALGAGDATSEDVGWVAVALVVLVVLVSYYAGGYVAGRMARFNGAKQGVAVFGWAVVATVVLAVLGAVAGNEFNVLDNVDGLPSFSSLGTVSLQTGVALAGVVVAALVGSILGGLAGMNFHRRVDKAGLPG